MFPDSRCGSVSGFSRVDGQRGTWLTFLALASVTRGYFDVAFCDDERPVESII